MALLVLSEFLVQNPNPRLPLAVSGRLRGGVSEPLSLNLRREPMENAKTCIPTRAFETTLAMSAAKRSGRIKTTQNKIHMFICPGYFIGCFC